jgi:Zn-dependent protease with chaperone function
MLGTMGITVAGLLVLWICYCLAATYITAFLRARAHAAVLRLAGRPDRVLDAVVVQHDRAASYCLPGRGGRIVVTSKAIQLLTPAQLDAVLAHERAHQRGHHHLLLCLTTALRRAIPRVRLVRYADEEVRRLTEVIADDTAARTHGDGALSRITRMAKPAARLERRPATLSALAVVASVVLPIVLAGVSIGVLIRHCPASTDKESLPAAVTGRLGGSAAAGTQFEPVD